MKIACQIKPNVKHDERVEQAGDLYVVYVKAPATEGKANVAAATLLAKHFGVPKTAVKLIRGTTSKHKLFELELPS